MATNITLFNDEKLFALHAKENGQEVIHYQGVPVGLLTHGFRNKAEFGWFGTWNNQFSDPGFLDFVRSYLQVVDRIYFSDYFHKFQDCPHSWCVVEKMVHTYIDIDGRSAEQCLLDFEKEKRRRIRKLIREQPDLSYEVDNQNVISFLQLHHQHLVEKNYENQFSTQFFKQLVQEDFSSFSSELNFVYEKDLAIAAVLSLRDKDWFYLLTVGLSDRAYDLQIGNYLYYRALEHAIAKGCRYFSLGITPAVNADLLLYKKRFGTQCHEYSNYVFYKSSLVKNYFQQAKKIKSIFKR